MELGLLDYFILLSVLQGILVGSAILLIRYFRSTANQYLGWFLILLSFIILLAWQSFDLVWLDFIWSIMWEYLLVGLLFHYFLHALDHPYRHTPWPKLFFWLFIVTAVVDVVIDLSFVFAWYELPFSPSNRHYHFFEEFEDLLTYWLFFLTVVGSLFLVLLDKRASKAKRKWLLQFSIVLLTVLVVWFICGAVEVNYGGEGAMAFLLSVMGGIFWWVGYYGVYRQRLLEDRSEIRHLRKNSIKETVGAPVGTSYEDQLLRLMREEELFRDPDLGRVVIAERLGISEGYLSERMRDGVGERFVDYVNGFRVRAACEMLVDEAFAPYSLEAIGQEAGFKSRSAFYESFKKNTGQTPGAFRKAQKTS